MVFEGGKRKIVALTGLAILGVIAWYALDTQKIRAVTLVVLAGFALRILLTAGRSPRQEQEQVEQEEVLRKG
jgi:hypothetical protein